MGTSRAARAPATKNWSKVITSLKPEHRNARAIAGTVFSVASTALGTIAPWSAPISYGASEGLRFISNVRTHGFQSAVRDESIRLTQQFVVPRISNGLWQVVASKMGPKIADSPFGRLAEYAFKKTLNGIMTKGLDAMEETR
nr:hypothetical protein [Candidatus Njordarchaeota archaeon]